MPDIPRLKAPEAETASHPALQADVVVVASTADWCAFSAMIGAARMLLQSFGGDTELTTSLRDLEEQIDRFGQQATAEHGKRLDRGTARN